MTKEQREEPLGDGVGSWPRVHAPYVLKNYTHRFPRSQLF
jgi:hypothetical protein